MAFSADLIRFISNIPVLNDGTIPVNSIETNESFSSTLYEPTYSLSVVARLVQSTLSGDTIEVSSEPLGADTVVYKALNSDLGSYAPNVYTLLRATVLESFALLYTIDTKPSDLQYMSPNDIRKMKVNLNYIADYLSTEAKYYHMIEGIRNMHNSLGYIENQIDVIMNDRGKR